MAKTAIGLYNDRSSARQVAETLEKEGFDRKAVHLATHGSEDNNAGGEQRTIEDDLVSELTSRDVPTDEARLYAEGVRRGGSLAVARVPDDRAEEAAGIMGVNDSVPVFERREDWEERGYTGYDPEAEPYTAEQAEAERGRYRDEGTAEEAQIPVVEERVKVGKRAVESGRVHIHTHVEKEPVEEQVHLRDEEVDVERREADRPLSEKEADEAFQEQEIEMTETDEEAVVEKEAHVTEEVVARKQTGEREETVHETERHTEVDIEDEDSGDFQAHEDDFRSHYRNSYASDEDDYDTYEPAYRHGYRAGTDGGHSDREYQEIRDDIRRNYEQKHGRGSFERVQDAVRRGFQRGRRSRST